MNRILIIEDDPAIREALEYSLGIAGFSVSVAPDGRTGLDIALAEQPEVILLDLMLPHVDGLTVCRQLRAEDIRSHIIMITALGTDTDKIQGLNVGADDYITKPFSFDELLARVRARLRRSMSAEERCRVMEFGDLAVDPERYSLTVAGQAVVLRPKEFQLLVMLASDEGRLFSRADLADRIWGVNFLGSSRTIDVHIQRLRKKIEKPSAFTFIRTVHGLGYRFEPTPKSSAQPPDAG